MKYIIDIPNEMVIKSPLKGMTLGIAMLETSTQKSFIIPTNIPLISFIEPQKWIPCSKEMPEIGTMLVSNGLNVAFGEYYGNDVWVIDGCEAEPILEEIAWMPLPEPWKGEEE